MRTEDDTRAYLASVRDILRRELLEAVMPFWMRHALDADGGINTCLRDDGSLVSRDRWLWSQWRAVWLFSRLYAMVEPRPEWLAAARTIRDFTMRHGWDAGHAGGLGGWRLCVTPEGKVVRGCESIYADGFAIYGLTALAEVARDDEAAQWARKTADSALIRLKEPHDRIPHFPYPVPPGARVHGLPMIFALSFWELGQLLDEDRYREAALELSSDIFAHFYRPDRDLLLERVAADNSEYPPPEGTTVVPGHVIEDMWFQIHIARDRGDTKRIAECVRLTRRHLELGWDAEYGGLLLAVDADGRDEIGWKFADSKLWWPQTETMYALLLAYEHSREDWCIDWYRRVHDYSFSNFPDRVHGEWRQKLRRDGSPFSDVVALPVKDPFHLPRALIYCLDVLGRLV